MTDTTTTTSPHAQLPLTTYTVHVYREMRLRFDGVAAGSPEEAAEAARDMHFDDADEWSDCEGETLAALVDVPGDEEFGQSRTVDFEPGRMLKSWPKLLEALKGLLGDRPAVQGGVCQHCGRDFIGEMLEGDCPSDDCPSFKARAAIAAAEGSQP